MTAHIHIIRTQYPHWGKYSGINQFVRYMDQTKYKVDMRIVSDNDEDFPIKNRIVRGCFRSILQKRGMQWYKLSDLVAEIKAFRKCRRSKVDVIHYLDGEHTAQFLPSLCRFLPEARPKTVATYHQTPERLDSLIVKEIIPRLDFITVVSPEQVSYFRELMPSDKIRLILHGIDIDYFKPRHIPTGEGRFRCITVGHWRRDFRVVREVAERLSSHGDVEFHIVSSEATELEDLGNVTVYRGIDDEELLKLYQESDILFLPLLECTANNALLEGIACGLPVVSTCLPSVKAYLTGKEAILIKNNDPKQFVDALLYLAHNPHHRTNMGREARKRAEELDWRNIVPQYEAIYSELKND